MRSFTQQMLRYRKTRKLLTPFISVMTKHTAIGLENIPSTGPLIIISNHRSDLDPLLISSFVRRGMMWVAAKFVFKIPFISDFLKDLGTIPISDDPKDQFAATKQIAKALRDNRAVGIFPEGAEYILKNDFSRRCGNFNSGFAHFALKYKANILPVSIIGIQEKVETWPVPDFIKSFFGIPQEVIKAKNRLQYKEVIVVFNKVININEFQNLDRSQGVNSIVLESKKRILEGIFSHGSTERRKNPKRQSGTRLEM